MSNWFSKPMKTEISQEEVMKRGESGEFHSWNFEPFDMKETGYEDLMETLKNYREVYAAAKTPEEQKSIIEEVRKIYRERDIFPIQYYSEEGILAEIEKCIAYKASFEGDTVSCVSGNTEYFNGEKWVKISEYRAGDKVLQYTLDGRAELVSPIRYISREGTFKSYISTGSSSASHQTDNHMCVFSTKEDIPSVLSDCAEVIGRSVNNTLLYKVPQQRFAEEHKEGFVAHSVGSAVYRGTGYKLTYTQIYRIVRDAEFRGIPYDDKLLSMSVEDRLRMLMYIMFINCTKGSGDSSYYVYSSTNKANLDFVSSLAFLVGYSVVSRTDVSVSFSCTDSVIPNMYECISESTMEGKYCFEVPSHMLVLRYNGVPYVTGNCGAGVGTTLCDYLFPNLYDTPSKHDVNKVGAETLFAKFYNDDYLKRSIAFCFSYKDGRPVPTSVMGGLRLVGSAPTNFRPMNAKAVYERFCPKGGVIYDYCCVDGDTEYFNGTEWKPISNYKEGEKVLQFNGDKVRSASLVNPIEYISYSSKAPFFYYESDNLVSSQTANHDVVLEENGQFRKYKQDEVADKGIRYEVPRTFTWDVLQGFTSKEYDEYIVKLCVMLYLFGGKSKDGSMVLYMRKSYMEYVLDILKNVECVDSVTLSNFSGEQIKISFKLFFNKYADILKLSKDSASFELCESFMDYSNLKNVHIDVGEVFRQFKEEFKSGFYVNSAKEADFIQFIMADRRVPVLCEKVRSNKDVYLVRSLEEHVGYEGKFKLVDKDMKYCFCVPSHMLVLRRKGRVYITGNCGFGGRMLGALSSRNNYKYVGTDPNVETMYHLNQLGEYIEEVTGREDSYELHCCGSEDFKGKPNSIDFAFSSPPYFDLEVYSDDPTQCYNKFPVLEEWLEGYVRQTIKNIIYMLKPGRVYAVNIADFKVGGGGDCAYVDEWIRISKEEGAPLFDNVYLGVTARAGSKEQAAGELKKENILIFKKPL